MLKNVALAQGIAKAHPLKRLGEGKDGAALAKFLLTEESSWVTGQIIAVDGEVVGGAKAFIIIWSKIPKYKFLSKIFSIKPLFFIFHYLYEIAAYFLFIKKKKLLK